MTLQTLIIRKVDRWLRIENTVGMYLAATDGYNVRFELPVTADELARINAIVQDFEFLLANTIEE